MATDEREDEQRFLAGLKSRTGRDLGEWMAAIAAQGFADKNQAIDWLREQGFPFARASWLERIHRNGGKPIYSDVTPRRVQDRPAEEKEAAEPAPVHPAPADSARLEPQAPALSTDGAASLEKLIAAAKGYRPLYHLLEDEIRKIIPALSIAPKGNYISMGAPAEFAAMTLHATGLRLGLDLGARPFDALFEKPKLKAPGAAITHMAVLTDARQVNEELLGAVRAANSRVNG